MPGCQLNIDERGVGSIVLDRPEQHNAFDDSLIGEMIEMIAQLAGDDSVRVVVLRAEGKSFSAGADLNWMRRMADYDEAQNLADAMQLAELMRSLNALPKPTIARVQGAKALFSLSEVKLGLIPAVISPYVVKAIGERASRRYMLSAERFDAGQAARMGLVHEVVEHDRLETCLDEMVTTLLESGPAAQAAAKDLILDIAGKPVDRALIENTARRIARVRASDEGREGLNAFLQKRKPDWVKQE
jgi:methylglutaconyl-CoA hydratase